jgi:uncharacterized coiled-coil protein SlyX
MRRLILGIATIIFLSTLSFAKGDPDAWKKERTLSQQYSVFKENLNEWNKYLFFNEAQLDDFYGTVQDSIKQLDNTIASQREQIQKINEKITILEKKLSDTQTQLYESLERENKLEVLGTKIDKNIYPGISYAIILILIGVSGFGFFLYFRSKKITDDATYNLEELKEEFEEHRKTSKAREMKLNRELQTERNKIEELKMRR